MAGLREAIAQRVLARFVERFYAQRRKTGSDV
jgi:hypothetical protein